MYQTLDPIYMRGVNMIIEKEMPREMRKIGDELVLDMDKMDNITLRKLDAFVLECLGKTKETPRKGIKEPAKQKSPPIEKIPSPPVTVKEVENTTEQNGNNVSTNEPEAENNMESDDQSQSSSSESEGSSSSDSSEEDLENNLIMSQKSNQPNKVTNGLTNNQHTENGSSLEKD